jgi:hypothetical protein
MLADASLPPKAVGTNSDKEVGLEVGLCGKSAKYVGSHEQNDWDVQKMMRASESTLPH